MANWTLAPALVQLRAEVNDTWPARSKASDGTLGDPAHASRTSDHNPNGAGVVRALDITANGIDAPAYAEHIRRRGLEGFPALQNHGYVIWNRQAAYATSGWRWQKYSGSNPHDKHCHVSVGRDPAQYDNTSSWRIAELVDDQGELTVGEAAEILKKVGHIDTLAQWQYDETLSDERKPKFLKNMDNGDRLERLEDKVDALIVALAPDVAKEHPPRPR